MKGLKTLLLSLIVTVICLTSCSGNPRQLKGMSEEDIRKTAADISELLAINATLKLQSLLDHC